MLTDPLNAASLELKIQADQPGDTISRHIYNRYAIFLKAPSSLRWSKSLAVIMVQ